MTHDRADRIDADRRPGVVIAALVILFLAAAIPLIARNHDRGRGSSDQNAHYLKAVHQFSAQWPHCVFRDYRSMTTPGYLLAIAAVHRFIDADVRLLRLASALVTAGLLATLAWWVGRRTTPALAILLCAPIATSIYVFSSGIWVLPDNAGWWGVLAILLLAVRPKVDHSTCLAGAMVLLALVFVRQVHLWTAAVLWMAAWLGEGESADRPTRPTLRPRVVRALWMTLLTLPAFALVGWFFWLWQGPFPPYPEYRYFSAPGNIACPAAILSYFAIAALFYLPVVGESASSAFAAHKRWIAIGALVGLVVAVIPHTSYSDPARLSGLWNVVRKLPTIADRSPLVWAMSSAGGAMLALWLAMLPGRMRWIVLTALVAFAASLVAGSPAWQRYFEPLVLMLLVICTVTIRQSGPGHRPRAVQLAPLALFTVAQIVVTVAGLR